MKDKERAFCQTFIVGFVEGRYHRFQVVEVLRSFGATHEQADIILNEAEASHKEAK